MKWDYAYTLDEVEPDVVYQLWLPFEPIAKQRLLHEFGYVACGKFWRRRDSTLVDGAHCRRMRRIP